MNLDQIIQALDLTVLTHQKDFSEITAQSGYTSDLLSCVMAGASHKSIWVTLQAHSNIVAVAALLELAAIIITEGAAPDQITIDKANEEGITLLSSKEHSFTVIGKLWEMGIRGK
jgi:hypothetical protein